MVHFRLLALGLAASTLSVALAAGALESCTATCGKHASQNGGGCKWEDAKCVCNTEVADCAKKTCSKVAENVNTLHCNKCASKKTLEHCQKAEGKSEHKAPVGGHHHGESAGKHDPDYKHKAKSDYDHDHKHDHGSDGKDKRGHEDKRQDSGKHGDERHARSNDKHDDAARAVPSHVHEGPHKFTPVPGHRDHTHPTTPPHGKVSEGDSKHHGEQERTREPKHTGKHAVKSTTEQQGKHGVNEHHDRHVGTVHSVPFNVHAGQHEVSTVPGHHRPYDDMPIPQRHGKHGVEPDSKHHHGEHEHDHRGKKAPKAFKPEFVPAYKPAPESETHHGHDKGPQHEGHGKTSAEAPHGAHASDKAAPGTHKEGSQKQPERQPKPTPKAGDKGEPSAKSGAGHAHETPKGEVAASPCRTKALVASKASPCVCSCICFGRAPCHGTSRLTRDKLILQCSENSYECICNSRKYQGVLMTCGAAGKPPTYEADVRKYFKDCQTAGHPVAALPKGKQGDKPEPGAHGEAGQTRASSHSTDQHPKEKSPAGGHPSAQSKDKQGNEPQSGAPGKAGKISAGSNSTDQHPAGGTPAILPKGKQGSELQPGAQTEAGKISAGSNSTDQGPKEQEPASVFPADLKFPACANPCMSVAQKKTKTNCTTIACRCTDSVFQAQFTACVTKTCNQVDRTNALNLGTQACNAASNSTTGGDGSNNDNPNSNTNPGTSPPSTAGVQNNASSAIGLRSSVGAVLAGAIGVAFATLL